MVTLLGKFRKGEKRLSAEERASLEALEEREDVAPGRKRGKRRASGKKSYVEETVVQVRKEDLSWRWIADCRSCGAKVVGNGVPEVGQRLCRCGNCKAVVYLAG